MLVMRESWPFLPEVRLFHSQEKALRFVRSHWDMTPNVIEGASAQTWSRGGESVVLMSYSGERETEDALLVHEATHVILHHFGEHLGEDEIGDEFMAYGIQTVSEMLMRAQEKWRRRK